MPSTKAAIPEGVLSGAGLALLRAIIDAEEAKSEEDEKPAFAFSSGRWKRQRARLPKTRLLGNCGLDASTGKNVDLIEAGVIDATKVVRVALENAVSVASTLLLTEATLTEEREKKAERAPVPEFNER